MRMTIEIPECFANGANSMVLIDIEDVLEYARFSDKLRSLSCEFDGDTEEYHLLHARLDQITELLLDMIGKKLIPLKKEEL